MQLHNNLPLQVKLPHWQYHILVLLQERILQYPMQAAVHLMPLPRNPDILPEQFHVSPVYIQAS